MPDECFQPRLSGDIPQGLRMTQAGVQIVASGIQMDGVLPPEAAAFLEPLGLNLRRPGDIGEYGPRQGGRWYMPMWHIAGRLLEAGEGELPVAPGVTAGFATDMGPFLRNFPEPCFQCWLSMTLPWVLEEPADEAADDRDDEVKTLDRRTEP